MRDHRYHPLSGKCVLLAIPFLMGAGPFFAETVKQSPTAVPAAMMGSPYPQNANPSTTPAEAQGDLLMANGDYAAAIAAYQQGWLRSAVTCNKIGVAYHHLFALEEARKYYQKALSLNPRYPDAINNLAAVYHGEGKYKKAEKTYKRALRYGPDSALTYRNLGTAYFSDGNYKEGANAYQKALRLNPHSFDPDRTEVKEEKFSRRQRVAVNYCLAKAYALAGKNEQAILYLRKALDAGFNDRRLLMEDKEFAQLRTTPEFQRLIIEQHPGS